MRTAHRRMELAGSANKTAAKTDADIAGVKI
jgi:hypothetical protein